MEFRRDIDFVIQIGRDEIAVEIDGLSVHGDEKSLRRDLSAESILHALETPLLRIRSFDVRNNVFKVIHQLVCQSQEKKYHQEQVNAPLFYIYSHMIHIYQKPVCLLTFLAKLLDYYFNVRAAFSVQRGDIQHTEHLVGWAPEESENAEDDIQVLKPGEYTSFTLKYLSMHADLCVDFESIHITSTLRLTQKVLIHAIAAIIHHYPVKSDTHQRYHYHVFNSEYDSNDMSALVRISVAELRRRIELLQDRSFAVSDELRELLMHVEPYNQKALGCQE